MYGFVGMCITTLSEQLKLFCQHNTQKGGAHAIFWIFKARLDDFNIYSLLNKQIIITIIRKLGLKILKLHTTL
jgi:hypothetical protein